MKNRLTSLLTILLIGGIGVISAQGYDDDDIYYNPSKAKAEAKKKAGNASTGNATGYVYDYNQSSDYPAADTYIVGSNTDIDVDAYNRRGIFAQTDTLARDSIINGDFAYTRRIEKFYNPQIVAESPDDVARYYYNSNSEPANINIYVNTPDYWSYPYYGPYYNSPWYWGRPYTSWYYNNWYYNSWAWGWDPYWHWGWGPSWSWGWNHGWMPPVHYPSWAHRPGGSIGNVRPGYTNGSIGNVRPGYRPGNGSGNVRPGNGNSGYRPSGTSGSYRPSNGNSGYRPGRGNTRTGNTDNNSYTRPSNRNNYDYNNSGYRGGSRGSSGSFGGGHNSGGSRSGGTGRGRH